MLLQKVKNTATTTRSGTRASAAPAAAALVGDGYTEGVNLYTSDGDLYNWKHAGLVFPANATGAHCLERPKVVKCPGTGK